MKFRFPVVLAVTLCLLFPPGAVAGLFHRRGPCRRAYATPVVPVVTATVYATPVPIVTAAGPDGPAAFLAALNAWRAGAGRGPVGWDANLAAFAATNAGVHAPGSSGGGAQCWAGVGSYLRALRMWQASPPHAHILLGAAVAVGCSPSATGMTCNAR